MPRSAYQSEQHLKAGQIAEKDIIAPFDFPILKSPQQLAEEKKLIVRNTHKVYRLSDEIHFNIIKKLHNLMLPLLESEIPADTSYINQMFRQEGIILSRKAVVSLQNMGTVKTVLNLLTQELDRLYSRGVYDQISADSLNLYVGNEIKLIPRDYLFSLLDAQKEILDKSGLASIQQILVEILPNLLKPNVIQDNKLFDELVERSFARLPKTVGNVTKNEIIIRSNSRITDADVNKIQSMVTYGMDNYNPVSTIQELTMSLSNFLYFFVLGLLLYAFCALFYSHITEKKGHFLPLLIGLAVNALLAILNNQILHLQTLLIPYSMTVLAAAIIIDVPFALFYNFLSFGSIYPFVNWETFSPLVLVLSTAGVLLLVQRMHDKHAFFSLWLNLVVITSALTVIFSLYKMDPLSLFVVNLSYALISSTLSIIILIVVVPYYEKKWNLATKQELLTLLDFNHPLLKKLAIEAIGTYYHSLIVGNLAERAAEAIGANALLARIGSYYHDIGKVVKPDFFTENNPGSAQIHDKLLPSESAQGIKSHVQEGLAMAKKYHLPPEVIDIILQHHGTGYIRYFLDKASKSRIPIDIEQYKYDGPKPKSKEAALVMIADIVESIAKSWEDINPDDIKKILDDTVMRLIKEGQLDESNISMHDLKVARESMIPILESVYRKRQQYPEAGL